MDREGTGPATTWRHAPLAETLPIPVIACGGAGSLKHVEEAVSSGKADAVSLASLLHYRRTSLPEIKKALAAEGVAVRTEHGKKEPCRRR